MTKDTTAQGDRPDEIAERHAQVFGDGPRITPLTGEPLVEGLYSIMPLMAEVHAAFNAREGEAVTPWLNREPGVPPSMDPDAMPELIRIMLHHGDLFARQIQVGAQLVVDGTIPVRERELIVLRVGWLCQAPYEWGEHVIIAKSVGLTSEEIDRIREGADAQGWTEREAAVLRATDELHGDATICDATWGVLAQHFDERQLIELPILVGQYHAVAYYQNALRLSLHHDNLGLRAR